MLGTYAAALLVIGASVPIGAAVLGLAGRRQWSWIAPALGLGVMLAVAWLAIRLPGEGLTALIAIVVLAAACGAWALPRVGFGAEQLREGGLVAVLALAAVSIPFIVEGHVGVLGTGFNVDMSQHLFTAEWISTQLGPAPPLIDQGYPVGPHSLAVATAELSGGSLVNGFTGITIAVPVVGAMVALAGTRSLGRGRGIVAALIVALPYLVASYLAQGAFKELFEAMFLLAFVLWLRELRGAELDRLGFLLPAVVIVAGAVYSYSGPGLAWLVGTVAIWGALEVLRDRRRALPNLRLALPGLAVAAVALLLAVGPEASRMIEFGGSAGNVATAQLGAGDGERAPLLAQAGRSDAAAARGGGGEKLDLFDNELGNLFGDIPPAEMFGIWPSGDFRVEPGDGAVPTAVFIAGALLGFAALLVGMLAAVRARETALLAGLAAAVLIWLAAWLFSTPYTTAKALQMIAPVLMLVSVRGVLDPGVPAVGESVRARHARPLSLLAAAFLLAAVGSSALALANAPVGPERYTAGIGKLRERLTGEPVLLLAPSGQLADRHGAAFYGWELRGARPICIAAFPEDGDGFGAPAPKGIRYVITLGGKAAAPFDDLNEISRRRRVALWEVDGFDSVTAPLVPLDADEPASCELGLP